MTDNLSKFTGDSMDKSEFQTLEDLMQRYSIKKPAVSARLKLLNIKPSNGGAPALYNKEQVADMDGLHQHILRTGKKDGYRKPTPSEPDEPVTDTVSDENLTEEQTPPEELPSLETASQYVEQESIMHLPEESVEINKKEEILSEIGKKLEIPPLETILQQYTDEELKVIIAQAEHFGLIKNLAIHKLADYFAYTGNFSNPEIIEMVRQSRKQSQQEWEAAHKSANPKALAQILFARAKQKAVGQKPTEA
ncbi:hypothetical protein [Iningainema tapete]|uniref:Uncharacterized protein n=1 Tax=Iningainema tapete BLCC-T55 TaxID=2748662 RepID=A0A8J6XRG4_9CYAN|nr:hypothetical protein [Iningainema tapete]MBD2777866.1 hypothetical protein [Iningainema tapete BLCC-T55]